MNLNPEVTVDTTQPGVKVMCPACGGGEVEGFFRIPELPANCIALCATREAALNVPKGASTGVLPDMRGE